MAKNHSILHDMDILDITMPLGPGMLVYDGDPNFWAFRYATAEQGKPATYNASVLTMATHAGTHVDPPLHFVPGGTSVEGLALSIMVGRARVIDLSGRGLAISDTVLRDQDLEGVERLLIKTDNSRDLLGKPFTTEYTHLTLDGAKYLREFSSLKLVGIDYVSIERFLNKDFPVHNLLLAADPPLIILEGLDLHSIESGDYELVCLPLRLCGGDGGPCRAVLIKR